MASKLKPSHKRVKIFQKVGVSGPFPDISRVFLDLGFDKHDYRVSKFYIQIRKRERREISGLGKWVVEAPLLALQGLHVLMYSFHVAV